MRKRKLIVVAILSTWLVGCASLNQPRGGPVIEDKLGPSWWTKRENVGTLALTPERRIVLVNFFNQRFCAEAPSETGLNLSDIANITGNIEAPSKGELALGVLIGSSSSNSVLNKRSQATQIFLANSYYSCQMYMNGAISGEQLVELQLETLNKIIPLLEKELPMLYGRSVKPDAPKDEQAAAAEEMGNSNNDYVPLDTNKILERLFRSGEVKTSEQEQEEKPKEQMR